MHKSQIPVQSASGLLLLDWSMCSTSEHANEWVFSRFGQLCAASPPASSFCPGSKQYLEKEQQPGACVSEETNNNHAALAKESLSTTHGNCSNIISVRLMWHPAAAADLVPAKVKMHIFYGMPKKTKLKTIFAPLCGKSPEQVMAPAVADAHKLGYDKLYRLLLDYVSSAMPRPSPPCASPGCLLSGSHVRSLLPIWSCIQTA